MDAIKYLALDLHIATITYVLMNAAGRVLQEGCIATSAYEIRKLLKGIRGYLKVTFEEGTLSQWVYEIVRPVVREVLVSNPRLPANGKIGILRDLPSAVRCRRSGRK